MGLVTATIAGILVLLFGMLAVPFIILGALLGIVLFVAGQILLLPFRLMGWVAGVSLGIVGFSIKAVLLILLALFVMAGLVVGLAPLVPLLLIVAGIWLLARSWKTQARGVT